MESFAERVLIITAKIPYGRVSTYGEIARVLGGRGYRAVGRALNKNKTPIKIPCHRVVKSDGSVGGYSRGIKKKIKLLEKEGVVVKNEKIIKFKGRLFTF